MKHRIEVTFNTFIPTVIMEIDVPNDRDTEEYIDELFESILDDKFKYNCGWDFI